MRIGLASPRPASSIEDGLARVHRLLSQASERGAQIVCFPEAYLPGLRGQDFDVPSFDRADEERVLRTVAGWSRELNLATILGMEHVAEKGRQIGAFVIDANGELQG